MAENLVKRGSVYYVRISAPKQLKLLRRHAGVNGKDEVWASLGTKDLATARRLRPAALERIYRTFEAETAQLRGEGARDVELTRPTAQDLESATFSFKHNELVLDEQVRSAWPSQSEIERKLETTRLALLKNPPTSELEKWIRPGGLGDLAAFAGRKASDRERREALAAKLQEHLANQDFTLVDWAVRDLARKNHWKIDRDSVEHKTLARRLMQVWSQALKTSFQRDEGVYEEPATVTSLAPPVRQWWRQTPPTSPRGANRSATISMPICGSRSRI